jgi:hypothetical protein
MAPNLKPAWPTWLGILGLLLLFVALRWNNFNLPLVRDEGEYAYAAQLLKAGKLPYEEAFVQKPPMVIYSYALAYAVAPNVYWAPRILACVCVACATLLLAYIIRREFDKELIFPVSFLFTSIVLLPGVQQFTANTEMFMLLPLLGCIAVCVRSQQLKARAGSWFLAGVLAAVTFWYKYTATPLLMALFAGWSWCDWRGIRELHDETTSLSPSSKPTITIVKHWFWAFLGGAAASLVILIPFLIRDGGKHLWECTIEYNRAYTNSSTFGLSSLWFCIQLLWADWWILFFLVPIALIYRRRALWFWAGMFLAAWLSTGASIYGHYYILIMPFWAILAALGIENIARWINGKFGWSRKLCATCLTVLVLFVVNYSHLPWLFSSEQSFAARRLGETPFLEAPDAATRVAQMTLPTEPVYVAGSEPEILFYSKRFSPTRFVIGYPLMQPGTRTTDYQQEVISSLEPSHPKVIVLAPGAEDWLVQPASPPEFFAYLKKLLDEKYERIGGYLPAKAGAQWTQPLPEERTGEATLILYRLK